jgi:putative oxidoreductase
MNMLLWILQATLALLYFAGGAYKLVAFDELAPQMDVLSRGGWGALGVLEMIGAVLLIVPAATKRMAGLTPIAAAVLALETLGLAALYSRYSLELTAANPLVWAAAMGVLAAVVAYGRYAQASDSTPSGRTVGAEY